MDKYLGKRLDGRYEMRELIGVGGMAYVYKAYDAIDDRIVAVKILKDEFLNNEEFVRRFRNESKAIAILNHPNIVKVLDVGFGERLQYIVMEYIDGITLKEYLDQRKDIRWKEAVHFTVQILRALQHAHDKGIVHRDIKPQNIMLLSDGTIKVTDFGIARLTRNEMKATVEGNKAIGSVHYISPEQARGEITDEKTDLYSVGIMLYETLTGRLPFEADNAVSVAIMQMQSEATAPHLINEEIPEGLEQITLKAMQKDTAKRYQSAAEMLSDFDEFKRNPSIKFEYTYMVDETPTRYVDAITRVRGESPEPKAKKDETVTTKKSNKKNISLVVILLVVTLLAVGGMVWFVFWLINGGLNKDAEEIKVEKFIGMSYIEEIKNNSAYSGKYKFNVIEEDANDPSRDVGEVFKQSPAFGSTVKKGATITLYVNNDTPDDVTLDIKTVVVGKHRDEVRKLLQDAGLRVQEKLASHDSIAKDHVIEVDIEMGKSYPYGKLVTVTVSSGVSKLEPIGFPPVLGYDSKEAMDFLKDEGFVGIIDVKEENYTGDTLVEQGVVMAIAVGGVRQETLPEKLAPDAGITLIVSSGLKNAEFELDWPQVINPTMMIDVRVKINGRVNTEFSQKFVGITVQDTIDKFAFTVTSHPTRVSYLFVVEVKKHGDSDDNYYVYTRLRIDPVTGAVMEELPYQHIPGITPEPIQMVAIPSDFYVAGMPADVAKNTLSGLGFVVVEQIETNEDWTEGTAVRIERDGVTLYPGQELEKGSTIVLVISSGSAQGGTDPTDPPFNPEFPVM